MINEIKLGDRFKIRNDRLTVFPGAKESTIVTVFAIKRSINYESSYIFSLKIDDKKDRYLIFADTKYTRYKNLGFKICDNFTEFFNIPYFELFYESIFNYLYPIKKDENIICRKTQQ
jgi:hypothetical protein